MLPDTNVVLERDEQPTDCSATPTRCDRSTPPRPCSASPGILRAPPRSAEQQTPRRTRNGQVSDGPTAAAASAATGTAGAVDAPAAAVAVDGPGGAGGRGGCGDRRGGPGITGVR